MFPHEHPQTAYDRFNDEGRHVEVFYVCDTCYPTAERELVEDHGYVKGGSYGG